MQNQCRDNEHIETVLDFPNVMSNSPLILIWWEISDIKLMNFKTL